MAKRFKNETLEERSVRLTAQRKKYADKQKVKKKERVLTLRKKEDRLNKWEQRLQVRDTKIKEWDANEEKLKEKFFEALVQTGGHRGLALQAIGTTRLWFKKMIASDGGFMQQVIDCMEDAEDTLQAILFTNAMHGNSSAAREYFRRTEILKAKLIFEQRIIQVQQEDVNLDKIVALKFAIKELMISYLELKASGRDSQALQALRQYIELLELHDVSGVGEYEVLTGTDLIKIIDSLGIKPDTVEDISFEEIADEDIKKHYLDMFPRDKIISDGKE